MTVPIRTRTLEIAGMSGDAGVHRVRAALRGVRGVRPKWVRVGSATIRCDHGGGSKSACAAITSAGFAAHEIGGAADGRTLMRKEAAGMPKKAQSASRRSGKGAGVGEGRVSAALDPAAKAANLLQLRRARGQVDGVERMIDGDRYCADIILQITAARASLQAVAKDLLTRHLKACHAAAMKNGGAAADEMYQELVDLVAKMAK
jgi:DNA-binding FrmR family transcriptional regulator